jgi:hypothetical protein
MGREPRFIIGQCSEPDGEDTPSGCTISFPWWWRIPVYAFLARAWIFGGLTDDDMDDLDALLGRIVRVTQRQPSDA